MLSPRTPENPTIASSCSLDIRLRPALTPGPGNRPTANRPHVSRETSTPTHIWHGAFHVKHRQADLSPQTPDPEPAVPGHQVRRHQNAARTELPPPTDNANIAGQSTRQPAVGVPDGAKQKKGGRLQLATAESSFALSTPGSCTWGHARCFVPRHRIDRSTPAHAGRALRLAVTCRASGSAHHILQGDVLA